MHGNHLVRSYASVQAERQKGQRKQQFISRTIFHPSFKNVSMPDAISFLDQQNEAISWVIRPSNKGTHQLSITMKVRALPQIHLLPTACSSEAMCPASIMQATCLTVRVTQTMMASFVCKFITH